MAKRPTGRKSASSSKAKSAKASKRSGRTKGAAPGAEARNYTHPEATSPLRPDVGVQAQFRQKRPPRTYRYDNSLNPALDCYEQPARECGEALIGHILDAASLEEAKAAAEELKAMSRPFLNWAGKAERQAVRLETEEPFTLILEVKGRPDPLVHVKAQAAQRCVDAVNAEASFGRWGYAIVRDPKETAAVVEAWVADRDSTILPR